MWRAALSQVMLGRLPPGSFAELHRVCAGLYRSCGAAAKAERLPLDAFRPKLAQALPGASEAEQLALTELLLVDGGERGAVKLRALEFSHKEPCEQPPAGREPLAGMLWTQREIIMSAPTSTLPRPASLLLDLIEV